VYDSHNKLVRIELADGSTTTYEYTPSGRIKKLTDSQGSIEKTYDSRGRLKTQTNPNNETITYSYDGVGNIVEIETPSQTISKTYTKRNQLKTVTDSQGTIIYDYDVIGRNTLITYSNGMKTAYEYDVRNRIIKIEHKNSSNETLQSFTYTLDTFGNRIKIVEYNNRVTEYEYNEHHQLTKEIVANDPNGENSTATFTYDNVGNLLTKTVNSIDSHYTYNENDQLIQKDGLTFTYDDNGNLVQQGNSQFEYDDKNRLIKVQTSDDTVEYLYDAEDNRIAKIVNGDSTTYLIDTNTQFAQVITESKSDGTTIEYTYGNDLLSQNKEAETLFYLPDALGSVRGLVNQTENLTDHYTYTPYGKLANHIGTSNNSFLFTGEQFDSEIDSYYLRARYYSPSFSRFLTRDTYDGTLDSPLSQNHYLYTHSNPINYTDPSGHMLIGTLYTSTVNMLSRTSRVSAATKKTARSFQSAYKMLCTTANRAMGQITHLHHVLPVAISGLSREKGEFVGMDILDSIHRTFHTLLSSALRLKGYDGLSKKTYDSLGSTQSYKDVFNILMDSAEYFDKVCEGEGFPSMRSKIWKELYQ